MAQAWRTPDVGEAAIGEMLDQPLENREAMFAMFGMDPETARALAQAATPQMGECILGLYRSADEAIITAPDRGFERLAQVPGLCLLATDDGFVGSHESIEQMAARCGAGVHRFEGLGHWWMVQDPSAGAAALQSFWASAGD
jgi:pimeloyl-ACP methyl ester carboxylesterase